MFKIKLGVFHFGVVTPFDRCGEALSKSVMQIITLMFIISYMNESNECL